MEMEANAMDTHPSKKSHRSRADADERIENQRCWDGGIGMAALGSVCIADACPQWQASKHARAQTGKSKSSRKRTLRSSDSQASRRSKGRQDGDQEVALRVGPGDGQHRAAQVNQALFGYV